MTEDEFWNLLDEVQQVSFEQRAEAVEELLEPLSADEIVDFSRILHEKLRQLDTPTPSANRPIGDSVLYMRCAAILTGKEAYTALARDPQLLERYENLEAESLLFAPRRAYERSTGLAWDDDEPGQEYSPWLLLPIETDMGVFLDPKFQITWANIADALNEATEWRSWWESSDTKELHLFVYMGSQLSAAPKPGIRRSKKSIKATVSYPRPNFASAPGATPADMARDAIARILSEIQEKLGMATPPSLPASVPPTEQQVERLGIAQDRAATSFPGLRD